METRFEHPTLRHNRRFGLPSLNGRKLGEWVLR